jgi:fumarylacetoacetase
VTPKTDETHDPGLRSWVESADDPATDFPIQNLPLGVFRRKDAGGARIGTAIGDHVLDLTVCSERGLLRGMPTTVEQACRAPALNAFMAEPARLRRALRHRLSHLLRAEGAFVTARAEAPHVLVPRSDVEMLLPAAVGDYTDFYASVFHATNVGALFRPDNPLLPNYKWVPIGYHGRASSLVASGTSVRRPQGQTSGSEKTAPAFGATRALDYELEMGAFLGPGNDLGEPVSLCDAEEQIVGLCLLNDWSARDVQKWEYQPLGPFLGKSFATSVSPWVVTLEALAPFRSAAFERPAEDPRPLPYLCDEVDAAHGAFDIRLEVALSSRRMREEGRAAVTLCRSNLRSLYWTFAQMVTHHASNGCNLRPGDLVASGTVSGPEPAARGCLLELTRGGREPVELPTGETRRFLEDGDEVLLKGRCERPGWAAIGFGECRGVIVSG